MTHRILIVEDELIVARDLQSRLKRMGYDVPTTADSAEEARSFVLVSPPDLILTDIRLGKGEDGVELAAYIRSEFDLPVIYITAFTDDETLGRAQLTEPYGYVVKPFHDRELQIAIEIAIYKHTVEKSLKENRSWLAAILQSMGDAVIATDSTDRIVFLNPAAETLTEWKRADATGKNLSSIFNVLMRKNFFSPWLQFSDRKNLETSSFNETVLTSKNGKERTIHSRISLLKDERGREIGQVVVFKDASAIQSMFLPGVR